MSGINLPVLTGDTNADQTAIRKALLALTGSSSGSSSSGTVIEPLSAKISHAASYSLTGGQGNYTIYIPSAYLVAASGGPYNLTLTTGASGATNYIISISPYGDTILSGDLLFDIYVSSSGNVAGYSWSVSGSNSYGTYIKFGDGTLRCKIKIIPSWGSITSVTGRFDTSGTTYYRTARLSLPYTAIDASYSIVLGNLGFFMATDGIRDRYGFGAYWFAGNDVGTTVVFECEIDARWK
jgi:hypothetical protein